MFDSLSVFLKVLFVCFDSLHPSQQFFSHVGNDLLSSWVRLSQYQAADKVSCSRAQHSDSPGVESRTSNPLIYS